MRSIARTPRSDMCQTQHNANTSVRPANSLAWSPIQSRIFAPSSDPSLSRPPGCFVDLLLPYRDGVLMHFSEHPSQLQFNRRVRPARVAITA